MVWNVVVDWHKYSFNSISKRRTEGENKKERERKRREREGQHKRHNSISRYWVCQSRQPSRSIHRWVIQMSLHVVDPCYLKGLSESRAWRKQDPKLPEDTHILWIILFLCKPNCRDKILSNDQNCTVGIIVSDSKHRNWLMIFTW